jgi:outer membrane receptor for ferrienterochelin and colicins
MTWVEGINENVKLSVGVEAQHETAFGKRIKDQTQSVTDLSLFGSTELQPLNGLVIRPGLRYTYNSTYDAPLIPSLHAKYGWGDWAVRASFGRGFRSPNLKDLFFFFVDSNHNIQGNLDLKAETSDNYQFSISHYTERENWAVSPSVRVFHNDVQNLIDLALVDGDSQLYQNINISEAKTQGVNAEVQLNMRRWTLSGGWAYTGITGTFGGQEELPDYQYYSQISFKTAYTFPEVGVVISSNAKYTSEQQSFLLEGDTLSRVSTESFTLLDAFVSKELFDKKLSLAVGVRNLLGVTDVTSLVASGAAHGSSSNTPVGTGRNLVFRLNYQWRK